MKTKFILGLVSLGLMVLSFGCRGETPNSDVVAMPTGNPEMQQRLLVMLDEKDIWHRKIDDTRIEIEVGDSFLVSELFDGIISSILPVERAFAPAPHALGELTETLKRLGVVCESVDAFDKRWLVCEEEDMKLVDDVLTEIVTRPADQD